MSSAGLLLLLERQQHVEVITAVLDGATAGRGELLIMEGGAGAGKTSLLDHGARLAAERGATVLRARGGDSRGAAAAAPEHPTTQLSPAADNA